MTLKRDIIQKRNKLANEGKIEYDEVSKVNLSQVNIYCLINFPLFLIFSLYIDIGPWFNITPRNSSGHERNFFFIDTI